MINNKPAGKLSRADYKFLMNLLSKAQAEAEEVIENDGGGGENKAEARLTVRRIMRIRLALIDLDEAHKHKR